MLLPIKKDPPTQIFGAFEVRLNLENGFEFLFHFFFSDTFGNTDFRDQQAMGSIEKLPFTKRVEALVGPGTEQRSWWWLWWWQIVALVAALAVAGGGSGGG